MKISIGISLILLFLVSTCNAVVADEVLTWKDCIVEAAKNNPDLLAAGQQVVQSVAAKKITASTLYPQVDASLGASTGRSDNGTTSSTGDSYSYGVTGTQLIFDGTKTINNVRSASETIKASQENLKFTSSSVRYKLRSAFIDLLNTQEMLSITQEIFNIRRSNLELISIRYASGLEHKGALMTSEADLADAKYGISQAERNLEVAQRKLIKEMGRVKFTPINVKGDFTVENSARVKPDFEKIVNSNPALLQAIAQKNAAVFSLKSTYANFSPTLSGNTGINKNDAHWLPQGDQWNLGFALTMPIFEGGLRLAQVDQAKALLSQMKENERSIKDAKIAELEQTWAALQDAMDNAEVQKKILEANEERSKIAQAQYAIGFISFDNWIIIEDNLVKSKRAYLDSQAIALLAEANWIQAKGETLAYE
ncbi:MAG: TolC family protein [Candidatus Omnitrophica bacterium]|nr:TolC family protein [Candidatus Omnitrophota bacterium]